MNKQLIEQIALETAQEAEVLDADGECPKREGVDITEYVLDFAHRFLARIDAERVMPDHGHVSLAHELWAAAQLIPGEGITDGVDRIAATLAREDAERGKDAVAECDREGNLKFTSPNGFINSGDCPHWVQVGTRLFLSPTIPEGMVLVPIEPTEAMVAAAMKATLSGGGRQQYEAMLAAAQGERL